MTMKQFTNGGCKSIAIQLCYFAVAYLVVYGNMRYPLNFALCGISMVSNLNILWRLRVIE